MTKRELVSSIFSTAYGVNNDFKFTKKRPILDLKNLITTREILYNKLNPNYFDMGQHYTFREM